MTVSVHQITASAVGALADGTSTGTDLEILARGQRSKSLVMLALVARGATQARHQEARVAADGWNLLARVQRQAPAAFEAVLRYPSTGAWAGETLLAFAARSLTIRAGHLAVIGAAAAARGGVPCVIEFPASECQGPELHLPSLGSQALPRGLRGKAVIFRYRDGAAEIRAEHAKVDLPRRLDADSPGWRALPAAVAGPGAGPGSARLPLVIDDADPYRLPGYDGSLERLSVRQREQWRRRITGGWRLLAHYHPQTEAELRALIGILTPLSAADGASRSVTSRRAFGTIALSLPADDLAMALTLVHEVQHAKLCALMDLLPLVEEPIAPDLYYAPWRPDPRPLASLLQGMYAHLGVARFWWRYRDVTQDPGEVHRAHVEFARWRNACVQVAKVVSNRPELTRSGMAFVDGMIGVLRRWRDEYVPRTAQNEADRAAEEHQRQWDRRTAQRETGHERRRRQG